MKRDDRDKLVLGSIITFIFLIFQLCTRSIPNNYYQNGINPLIDPIERFKVDQESGNSIVRVKNEDASLAVPFLDKINKFWYVGGQPQIRNAEYIRLISASNPDSNGLIMSNGIGDNTINDFEIIMKFKISSNKDQINTKKATSSSEGLVLLITPENEFLTTDLHSTYSKRQYEINSGGILPSSTDLMGFPKNFPGLSLVLDCYQNDKSTITSAPFFDAFINNDPSKYHYDRFSDGKDSNIIKLNPNHIKLKDSMLSGDDVELRLIYLESINFLKIDIKYESEGNIWIELYQSKNPLFVPKNPKTGQRFIGVGALSNENPVNIDILNIQTNEFHWEGKDESIEESFDYVQKVQLFLQKEFGQRVTMERDEFIKWKYLKAQPSYKHTENTRKSTKFKKDKITNQTLPTRIARGLFKVVLYVLILAFIYLATVYIRVTIRHIKKRNNYNDGLLPRYV
ncbi:hypothetical protein Kpol_448p5 [Vanderwaltozyma polyspora DSM 70294]|uniref:L-type lectin-like domain-containing protein n=1 Tax=Vanderwaltozyma polyspora (strain ATCC 22028 / DSM 70294 / BCRC 21397 / CBS 2163 / NBRC 10782 / NRRL Y-8283 / UCD 57-17) TaxID=436907 RepID=A7TQY1_VANPO|nr:uncharacterized protein Kpol_448p5 [Vanderwaltozyma polyspora DSM 70294]EDO15318.1 hypothetical protein Kpol_448p5 [Vanderwaltozyma polyspora DSM 70294]